MTLVERQVITGQLLIIEIFYRFYWQLFVYPGAKGRSDLWSECWKVCENYVRGKQQHAPCAYVCTPCVCVHTRIYVCTPVRMCAHPCVCVCTLCICVHTRAYMCKPVHMCAKHEALCEERQVCLVGEVLGAQGKQWKLLSEFHSVQNGHWNKNSTAIKMDRKNINWQSMMNKYKCPTIM